MLRLIYFVSFNSRLESNKEEEEGRFEHPVGGQDISDSVEPAGLVQGCLAHKKQHPPLRPL